MKPSLNDIVACDFETIKLLSDGTTEASTEFYHPDFRVSSCAFTERKGNEFHSWYVDGEENVRSELSKLQGRPLIPFNLQFEMGVARCRFPGIVCQWYCDVQRLSQLYDNGGNETSFELVYIEPEDDEDVPDAKKESTSGFGLVKTAKRILGKGDHKTEAYEWIHANVPEFKKGKEGSYLDRLPPDVMERYNIGDTEITFELYEYLTSYFDRINFDWTKDNALFLASVNDLVESQIRGIPVDVEGLRTYAEETVKEIEGISRSFLKLYEKPIKDVERLSLLNEVRKRKTLRGRKKYVKRIRSDAAYYEDQITFNPGSNKQLQMLFVEVLKIKPFFFTPKLSPSFKSSHLHQWGEGGSVLENRRKRMIVKSQSEALVEKSSWDSRYHVQLRAVATKTGRYSGTGGVNVQALSRRDHGLMSRLLPDPGFVFVGSDMSAGEPTIITEFTKDQNYKYFCFDGVGKRPFYDGNLMKIDDIYLAYASVCPMFAADMKTAFDTGWEGLSFADWWMKDPEYVKGKLKKIRKNAKWILLGLGYGLGAKSLYPKALEAGLKVTMKDCKGAFDIYWWLFSDIKAYADRLEKHTKKVGWFENPFGYRFAPTEYRKCFNGMIQSSVSGLFHWYGILMKEINPFALYVTTIHDENIYMCPEDKVEDFAKGLKRLTEHINSELKWSVDLRFGIVTGKNLYECK